MIDNNNKKDIRVRTHLSRWSGGADLFNLVITDDESGLIILDINLDIESFADLMSNRSTLKTSEATYYGSPNIGKKHECKTYQVPLNKFKRIFEKYGNDSRERDMKLVFDFAEKENPGWKADQESYNSKGNSSKQDNDGEYTVTLRRYV